MYGLAGIMGQVLSCVCLCVCMCRCMHACVCVWYTELTCIPDVRPSGHYGSGPRPCVCVSVCECVCMCRCMHTCVRVVYRADVYMA